MSFLPPLRSIKRSREMIGGFAGLNHNPVIYKRECYDMRNMQSGLLPVLSPRRRRARVRAIAKPNGLFAHERLCWVDGTAFYYDGEEKGQVSDCEKRFVRMGAYVLIWPDKCFYNTHTDEFGSLEAETTATGTVTISLCRSDGVEYEYTASDEAPEKPEDGQYWVDTSDVKHTLKLFSAATGLWASIATVYTKISSPGIGAAFRQNDGVTIEGLETEALNGNYYLVDASADAVIVVAIIDGNYTQDIPVTLRRAVPALDYMTVCNNRVWGCSSANHEIYACKLGDPMNWNTYMGISTDSYAVTVGSGGDFTGCCTHLGYVLFFKERMIHKLFGSRPGNYQLDDSPVRGVAAGSEKSLLVVNETLLYRSGMDVCGYGGALPTSVSEPLGGDQYKNAVAGALGHLYYISMEAGDGSHALFVYDTKKGCWMREDDTHARWFAAWDGDLYYIDGVDNCLYSVTGRLSKYADEDAALEPPFVWYTETGDIGLSEPDAKYISGVQLFVRAEPNAHLRVQVQTDEDKPWEDMCDASTDIQEYAAYFTGSGIGLNNLPSKRAITLPIHTPRCNTMRLRMSGVGDVRIYSLALTREQGSDRDGI